MNANLAPQLRQHQRPLFRADHVGSLLRPPALLKAREQFAAGQIPAAALRRIEDAAVRDAVRLQEELGLQSITDGEFRRQTWHMDFLYQIGGVSKAPGNLTVKFCNEHGQLQFTPEQPRVTSKLRLAKCLFGEDFSFLRSVTKATPKVTIPSPSMMHYRGGRAAIDPAVYPDMEEFWEDLADVYACETRCARDARLCVRAARRHEPRLSQRSGAAEICRRNRRGRRARSTTPTSS